MNHMRITYTRYIHANINKMQMLSHYFSLQRIQLSMTVMEHKAKHANDVSMAGWQNGAVLLKFHPFYWPSEANNEVYVRYKF